MVIFHLFGKPILKILSGLSERRGLPSRRLRAKASRNIPSVAGREDYVRVKLEEKDGTLWAHPLFGKSGAISHLVQADGLIKIGIDEEGLEEGEEAEVILLMKNHPIPSFTNGEHGLWLRDMKRNIYLKKKTLGRSQRPFPLIWPISSISEQK